MSSGVYLRRQRQAAARRVRHLVEDVVGARVDHLDHDVGVEEVGGDHVGYERSVFLLEHDGDDVVPYVSLPLQLQHNGENDCDPSQSDLLLQERIGMNFVCYLQRSQSQINAWGNLLYYLQLKLTDDKRGFYGCTNC